MSTKLSSPVPTGSENGAGVHKFSKARPLAARLGIHAKTIFRWADAGFIHRHKINDRVVLFDESEVASFIESARVERSA
jgi:predicted site-specific integrase-resolvase